MGSARLGSAAAPLARSPALRPASSSIGSQARPCRGRRRGWERCRATPKAERAALARPHLALVRKSLARSPSPRCSPRPRPPPSSCPILGSRPPPARRPRTGPPWPRALSTPTVGAAAARVELCSPLLQAAGAEREIDCKVQGSSGPGSAGLRGRLLLPRSFIRRPASSGHSASVGQALSPSPWRRRRDGPEFQAASQPGSVYVAWPCASPHPHCPGESNLRLARGLGGQGGVRL